MSGDLFPFQRSGRDVEDKGFPLRSVGCGLKSVEFQKHEGGGKRLQRLAVVAKNLVHRGGKRLRIHRLPHRFDDDRAFLVHGDVDLRPRAEPCEILTALVLEHRPLLLIIEGRTPA